MSFDAGSLLASLLISSVGFVAFAYGKKQQRLPSLVAGLLWMVFPYFVPGVWPMLLIAALIAAALWASLRAGF